MSETPAPSNFPTVALVLLMGCVAVLLYLDWRRAGEIDNLHARIDGLPQAAPRPLRPQPEPGHTVAPPPPAPQVFPPQPAEHPPPAPERAMTEGDVITDPLAGRDGGANGMPTTDVHPLLRSVLEAHGETP